jgi:hypothetical protein
MLPPLITLMMEAASTYETSLNFYESTQSNKSEDSHLHTIILFFDPVNNFRLF